MDFRSLMNVDSAIFVIPVAMIGVFLIWKIANGNEKLVYGLFGAILLGALVIGAWHDENAKWEKFKVEHGCKVVEHIKGDIQTGVGITTNGSVGMMVIPESDKTGYLCDDGVTYWR